MSIPLRQNLVSGPGRHNLPSGDIDVHRKHVLDPPEGESSAVRTFTLPEVSYGGSVLRAQIAPRWVSFTRSVPSADVSRIAKFRRVSLNRGADRKSVV